MTDRNNHGAAFADLYNDFSETESGLSYTHPSRDNFIKNITELGVGEGTYVVVYDQGIVEAIRETFENAGVLNPNKKVIVYCGFGVAETWMALLLNQLGKNNIAVYDGSKEEWASDLSCPLEINVSM